MAEAAELLQPILINTLPALLDNLAEMLSPEHPRENVSSDSTLAHEHGGERARLTNYHQGSVIKEYRILRSVLIAFINEEKIPHDQSALNLIHAFIDQCIQASATTFSLIQASLREHLIATLTHDMRSPLTAATLAADMILRNSTDESIKKHANKIKLNNRRIDGMIHDLLNTTMLKSGGKLNLKYDECSAKLLLEELVEELPSSQAERIRLDCEKESISGHWDRGHVKRALENLITNAFKYGDAEGAVTLKVCLTLGRVIFTVHNEGAPIPKEELETIFNVFRRAEAAIQGRRIGWGLGLPIVRAVAEAHGGSLSVDSLKELGTTFIFDIPQDARPFAGAPQTE